MKSTFFLALALIASVSLSAQGVVGKWKTIDDKTGLVKSIVEIREQNGELYGKSYNFSVQNGPIKTRNALNAKTTEKTSL